MAAIERSFIPGRRIHHIPRAWHRARGWIQEKDELVIRSSKRVVVHLRALRQRVLGALANLRALRPRELGVMASLGAALCGSWLAWFGPTNRPVGVLGLVLFLAGPLGLITTLTFTSSNPGGGGLYAGSSHEEGSTTTKWATEPDRERTSRSVVGTEV